jgi:putative Holliday junction resolvase
MTVIHAPLLGIDHGVKRIGLAVSDRSWLVARELMVIHRTTREADFVKINAAAVQNGIGAFVIGLPSDEFRAEGEHTQADTVKLWVERFQATTTLPVIFWDEQMTSEEAKSLARRARRKPDAAIDDLAARVILQSYLDALRDRLAPHPFDRNEET